MRHPLTLLALIFVGSAAACSVTTTEPAPAPASTPPPGTDTPADPPADDGTTNPPATPATPTPPAAKDIDKITLSGRFAQVDVVYERAGQFIVLDMKGDASAIQSSDKSLALSKINVAKLASYDLLFPQKGACDRLPEVTIEKGVIHLALQHGGKPSGVISDCHFLAEYIKMSDGGFQATLKDVPVQGGGKIKELVIDLLGPQ